MKNLMFIPFLFVCNMLMGQAVSSFSVIGKSIKIGNLIVAQNDFPNGMNWKCSPAIVGKSNCVID